MRSRHKGDPATDGAATEEHLERDGRRGPSTNNRPIARSVPPVGVVRTSVMSLQARLTSGAGLSDLDPAPTGTTTILVHRQG